MLPVRAWQMTAFTSCSATNRTEITFRLLGPDLERVRLEVHVPGLRDEAVPVDGLFVVGTDDRRTQPPPPLERELTSGPRRSLAESIELSRIVDADREGRERWRNEHRSLISARTREALAARRAEGRKTGGKAPYGFAADPAGNLTPVPQEQAAIARATALRAEPAPWSLTAIAARSDARASYRAPADHSRRSRSSG